MKFQTKTITITSPQTTVILSGLSAHKEECERQVQRMKETRNEKTAIAAYWQQQLDAANLLFDLVAKTPFDKCPDLPACCK